MLSKPLFLIAVLYGFIQIVQAEKIYNIIVNSPNTDDDCNSQNPSHPQVVINTADI
jgi:hypothetical protein